MRVIDDELPMHVEVLAHLKSARLLFWKIGALRMNPTIESLTYPRMLQPALHIS